MSSPSRAVDRTPSERVDVCVIGGGVAGALVAHELGASGYDTVMLEAGERFDRDDRFERMETALRPGHSDLEVWNVGGDRDAFTSSGERFYPLNEKRVKGVGGTTLHWGGYTPRLHEKDFEMASRYGLAEDWPISYEDLRPYYRRAERALGVAGDDELPRFLAVGATVGGRVHRRLDGRGVPAVIEVLDRRAVDYADAFGFGLPDVHVPGVLRTGRADRITRRVPLTLRRPAAV